MVAAVRAAHPEVNPCDESSLTSGRALLVDWAAQRLNARDGQVRWGRKSRGKPSPDGKADRPNTDALTFLRPDGLFEIYDVISGGAPCNATWTGYGPFKPGENGYWAPPQLPAEGGTPPPPDDTIEELRARVAELEAMVRTLRAEIEAKDATLAALQQQVAELEARVRTVEAERDTARKERDDLANRPPPTCEPTGVPGWLKVFGVRAGCRVIQP
jgi:hypothetical protein